MLLRSSNAKKLPKTLASQDRLEGGGARGRVQRRRRQVPVAGRLECGNRHRSAGARRRLEVRHVVLLFPLHAPVLEPDLDLALAEVQHVRDLDPAAPRQVAVEVELLFQFERLVSRVRGPRSLAVRPVAFHCDRRTHTQPTFAITTALSSVYTIQPVVKAVEQPAASSKQTFNRLFSRFDNQLNVCLHDAARCSNRPPVEQPVVQPVGCFCTRYNSLFNRLFTSLTTGCIM